MSGVSETRRGLCMLRRRHQAGTAAAAAQPRSGRHLDVRRDAHDAAHLDGVGGEQAGRRRVERQPAFARAVGVLERRARDAVERHAARPDEVERRDRVERAVVDVRVCERDSDRLVCEILSRAAVRGFYCHYGGVEFCCCRGGQEDRRSCYDGLEIHCFGLI